MRSLVLSICDFQFIFTIVNYLLYFDTGLRTIYCNPETRLCLLQCRHGPHRLVASSLPFLDKIGEEDKLIPRLIYTGATIRNCYKVTTTIVSCKEIKAH